MPLQTWRSQNYSFDISRGYFPPQPGCNGRPRARSWHTCGLARRSVPTFSWAFRASWHYNHWTVDNRTLVTGYRIGHWAGYDATQAGQVFCTNLAQFRRKTLPPTLPTYSASICSTFVLNGVLGYVKNVNSAKLYPGPEQLPTLKCNEYRQKNFQIIKSQIARKHLYGL